MKVEQYHSKKPLSPKDENLWNSHWCLIRTHHNYPLRIYFYIVTIKGGSRRAEKSREVLMMMMKAAKLVWAGLGAGQEQGKSKARAGPKHEQGRSRAEA